MSVTSKYKLGEYLNVVLYNTSKTQADLTLEDIQKYFQDTTVAYQAFTRKPDNTGNCFCLVLVYMKNNTTIAFSTHNSNPNVLHCFRWCYQLPTIYVAPMEYKELQKSVDLFESV